VISENKDRFVKEKEGINTEISPIKMDNGENKAQSITNEGYSAISDSVSWPPYNLCKACRKYSLLTDYSLKEIKSVTTLDVCVGDLEDNQWSISHVVSYLHTAYWDSDWSIDSDGASLLADKATNDVLIGMSSSIVFNVMEKFAQSWFATVLLMIFIGTTLFWFYWEVVKKRSARLSISSRRRSWFEGNEDRSWLCFPFRWRVRPKRSRSGSSQEDLSDLRV
jgi:cbb3-type cytochrome oxidase subunit 3